MNIRTEDMMEFVSKEMHLCEMWGHDQDPAAVRINVMCCQIGVRILPAGHTGSCSPYTYKNQHLFYKFFF